VAVHTTLPGSGFDFVARCGDDGYRQRTGVVVGVFPGQEYWIQVGGFQGASGNLELSITKGGAARFRVKFADDGSTIAATGICPSIETQLDQGPGAFSYGAVFDGTFSPSTFELRGLPAGAVRAVLRPCSFSTFPSAPPFAPLVTPWMHVTEGEVTTFPDVLARRPASLRVVVRDVTTGLPIAGAFVNASPVSSTAPDRFGGGGSTGADGSVVISQLSGGSYRLFVSAGAYSLPGSSSPGISRTVDVAPESAAETVFELARDGAIEGVVRRPDGSFADAACVQAFPDKEGEDGAAGGRAADGRHGQRERPAEGRRVPRDGRLRGVGRVEGLRRGEEVAQRRVIESFPPGGRDADARNGAPVGDLRPCDASGAPDATGRRHRRRAASEHPVRKRLAALPQRRAPRAHGRHADPAAPGERRHRAVLAAGNR
jgi:hypothetical protein